MKPCVKCLVTVIIAAQTCKSTIEQQGRKQAVEDMILTPQTHTAIESSVGVTGAGACSVCGRETNEGERIAIASLPEALQSLISVNMHGGALLTTVCGRCVEIFERARVALTTHSVVFEQGGHVLSTPLRLDADERFTGRGVTIAFLDSGFYSHPDLITPKNRIVAYHTIVRNDPSTLETPDGASWHGMMTSVVAAGNGALSNGFYRGIAPDARLALVKISTSGRIPEQNIRKGLEWVMAHADDYDIASSTSRRAAMMNAHI
jgi:serine protease AprX